ncbi:NEDD4-binding protein 2 isoform X2 [Limanda limanda]|nr:NEDD4-binding protein 2 isoform X2 [Limanda limanda]
MDSLLELSVAAEGAAPIPSPVSGFERTAEALLRHQHFPDLRAGPDFSQQPYSPPSDNLLTEELDLLVDQELETLTAKQDFIDDESSQYLSTYAPLSSFPPPPFPQQPLPELLQSSLTSRSSAVGGLEELMSPSSPLDELSSWDDDTMQGQPSATVVDFKHLLTETPADNLKPPFDLAASGRPSAFQVYKKEASHGPSEGAGIPPSDQIVGGARSKVNMLNREPIGYMSSRWNLRAPEFSPFIHQNQGPTFITPVAQTSSTWPSQIKQASPWLSHAPVSQAPLKPSATIPKSWALPSAPPLPAQHSRLRLEGTVLVMLRGAPGSGKSTLASALLEHNPGGAIFGTDDYFIGQGGQYHFDPTALGEAHEWNHKRAKEAFERGTNPIIIDNTNMQGWEMRPYVIQALKHGYKVLFREPDTWWKNKPRELERRTTHNVSVESIRRMLNGCERFVTVRSIMGSHMPEWKGRLLLENKSSQPASSQTLCPDLVGEPGLPEGCNSSRSQLFSSLPDVSSIGRSSEGGELGDSTHQSTGSLNFQPAGRPTENPQMAGDLDLGELDSELDAQSQLNNSVADPRIPDCIVESVMNEDHRRDEIPVAFSASIGQRVRRERPSRRSEFDRLEPADLVKDTNPSESEAQEDEAGGVDFVRDEEEMGMPKMLDFLGDWPSEGSLDQRQMRRHKERNRREDESAPQQVDENEIKVQPGPDITEFQKVLDLLQIGVGAVQISSTHSSSLSLSAEEELVKGAEAGGREEREENMNTRGELPDCVLAWKAADFSGVRESNSDKREELEPEKAASSSAGGSKQGSDNDSTHPPSAVPADSLVIPKTAETSICQDEVGNHKTECDVVTEPGDMDINSSTGDGRETGTEADCSLISEGSVEAEGTTFSGGSQEKKQRPGRRSGKQCKLALTFTQNCPGSLLNSPESPNTTAQIIHSSQSIINTDVKPSLNPNCGSSLNLKTNVNPFTESNSEAHALPPSPPVSPLDTDCFTQTEPQDVALMWRLNRQDSPDDAILTACSHSGDFKVLYGDSSRFVPEPSTAAIAVHPFAKEEIFYRVAHEKGTQVEEKELGGTKGRLESLCILSRHFKLVSFDSLEDLYDKCHQDLEWTTNLLLDSEERFFKEEDAEEEQEECAVGKDDQNTSAVCGGLGDVVEPRFCPNVLDERLPEDLCKGGAAGFEEGAQQSTSGTVSESNENITNTELSSFESVAAPVKNENQPDTTSLSKNADRELVLQKATREIGLIEQELIPVPDQEGGAWGWGSDDGVIIEESRTVIEEEIASMDEVHRLLQAELEEMERDEKQRKEERRTGHLNIQSVELKLPTEVALQLTELFGPVGLDQETCSTDDYTVQMDLNLAKLLHQKWKETIQEKQRQASLSFHLPQESSGHWRESQMAKPGQQERTHAGHFVTNADGYTSLNSQSESRGQKPIMDHWNVFRQHVSLRDIIKEEQALQENVEKTRQSRSDLDRRDGATLVKENKLFSLFPAIDKHFLMDIFRDHNYSLMQTELFLRSLLDEGPVKTVVAPEAPRSDHHRTASKEREKRQKAPQSTVPDYQDVEDPEYVDFRAEASLQRSRQLEGFAKAAEAFKQGRKDVASFYAQQGHMHGQRMREANHRAAVQIFERVNSTLLPRNILDLHGLHVDEAMEHLAQVLHDKTTESEQGLCRPQLSVITGRGNHSQGGVARIRPAVIDYLTNNHYRFTEPKPGLMLVSLK